MMEKSDGNKGTALLVIDVQTGLFERTNPIYEAEQVLENINSLMRDARKMGVPVIFVQHANENTLKRDSREWQLHPDIKPLKGEVLIHKVHGDAFIDTELKDELEKRNVKALVVTGLVTHGCVKATSLGALKRGYEVTLVSDGHSNFSEEAPKLIKKWNQEVGRKGAEVVAAKDVDFSGI
ncbi:MAG: cysteine hydrolase [Anaerolineales bacterium]|jgi:nicotinamidase-related amidase